MWTPTTRTHYSRRAARYQSDLTDEEWRVIEPHLPTANRTGRPPSTPHAPSSTPLPSCSSRVESRGLHDFRNRLLESVRKH